MSGSPAPTDKAIREQALDPTRSFIVEAPAGSGKTELLTRRYLKLLAHVTAPEEILAITFTRKAAAEMRGRVLKSLALATQPEPKDDVARESWRLAMAAKQADEKYGWQLASHPARLRITTIDAFNSALSRQLPILSGAGATLPIARDTASLYSDVALRLLERLSGRDDVADVIARLMRHLDNRPDVFESLLSDELERREYWLDLGLMRFDLPELRGRLEATLEEAVARELGALCDAIPADARAEITALASHAAIVLNSLGAESPITSCDSLRALPDAIGEMLPQWRGIAELLLTKEGAWRKRIDKNLGFPPEDRSTKKRLTDLLARLERESDLADLMHLARKLPSCRYENEQWQALMDLLAVLKLSFAELDVVMRERGEVDYIANAIAARRSLGTSEEPTDLALRLDYRLQHVLVDEFQDTSRGQVELLALLTAGWTDGDGHTLFCVGDPMQSIYRFRHADVGLFLNLKRHGLNQLRLTPLRLTVNFRATAPILEWVNRTFAATLPKLDDPARGAVAFTASDPRTDAARDGGVFVHPILRAVDGDKFESRIEEAKQIGTLIEKSLVALPNGKIGVLVSNRLHLQALINELHRRGIAFQAVEIDPLAKRPAIQDLIALTRALVHLGDRTAWLSVLRAPWCGLSLADLNAVFGDPATLTLTPWQLLADAQRLNCLSTDGRRRVDRVLPVFAMAIAARGRLRLRECVERAWNSLAGPAVVANETALRDCEAYFARLEEVERVGDLEDVARLEAGLRDLYAGADVSASNSRVELMTIHRAKGLEFDIVILPALDSGARSDSSPLMRVQELPDLDGGLLLAPIARRGSDQDSIYAWLEFLDKSRARLEQGRLLYVAATRARRELHLFGAAERDVEVKKPSANTFLSLLWPMVEPEFATRANPFASSTPSKGEVAAQAVRTQRLPVEWHAPVPEESFGETEMRDVVESDPLPPPFEWVGETARHIGTLVHREIENIAQRGLMSANANELRERESSYLVELAELGVPPHLRQAAAARVVEAISQLLKDERGRWILAGDEIHRETASELALSGLVGRDIVNVVIDRTFVARDGTRWIVDFKTSTHEGGGREEFLDSEVERYRPQLMRYAQLMSEYRPGEEVKAALYFPLLGAWREVPV